MNVFYKLFSVATCLAVIALGGCVERQLTIETFPSGAKIELNDEPVGISPVTVSFNWYGTYKIRAEKQGYKTLFTSEELKRPAADYFPLDLFRELLTPDAVDSYQWAFELEPLAAPDRAELIERAYKARTDTDEAIGQLREKIQNGNQ
jgi:hypothetical protein